MNRLIQATILLFLCSNAFGQMVWKNHKGTWNFPSVVDGNLTQNGDFGYDSTYGMKVRLGGTVYPLATRNYVDSSIPDTSSFFKKDGSRAATGNFDMGGSFKITNAASPSASGDYATKGYVDGLTGGGSASSSLAGAFSGLELYQTGNTTVNVIADVINVRDGSGEISITSLNVTGNIATSGGGGLDTGSVSNNTFYNEYVITLTDGSSPKMLFSLSATSPTMPGSYTRKRRVGKCLTDGSAHIRAFYQIANRYAYDGAFDDITFYVLNNGNATTYTTVDFSSFVAPGIREAILNISHQQDGNFRQVNLRYPGSSNATTAIAGANVGFPDVHVILGPSRTMEYRIYGNTSYGAYICVQGWVDNL